MKYTVVTIIGEGTGEDAMRPLVVICGDVTKERVMPYLVEHFNGSSIDLDELWDEGHGYTGCETVILSINQVTLDE